MTDFNATLTRAFAEAAEPADDGFSVHVADTVARREKSGLWRLTVQGVGFAIAAAAIAWGLMSVLGVFGPEFMASFGLEIARVHGAMTQASSFDLASLAANMAQVFVIIGALTGGAVAYRSFQQQ